jgi:hypothetical protein
MIAVSSGFLVRQGYRTATGFVSSQSICGTPQLAYGRIGVTLIQLMVMLKRQHLKPRSHAKPGIDIYT